MFEFDDELAGMVNYTDETVPQQMPAMERKVQEAPKAVETTDGSTEEIRRPVYIRKRTDLQRIGSGLRWLLPCAVIAYLLWWFEVNGLMAMQASYPCVVACGCIGFGGFFWNARA